MMPRAVCILAVLLVIGILCSGSVSPAAAVQTVKKIATTATTAAPVHPQLVTINTPPPWIMVNINSAPPDANVTVDGSPALYNTPDLVRLAPGTHTIVIAKSGYHSYTTTVTLVFGMDEQFIMANLEGAVNPAAMQTKNTGLLQVTGVRTFMTTPSAPDGPLPLTPGGHQVTTTTIPVRTITCPPSDWTCMPLSEAEKIFGVPYTVYGNAPCGYLASGSRNIAEYCCQKGSSSGISTGADGALSIRNVSSMNRTLLQIRNYTPVQPVTPLGVPARQQTGPMDSLFGFVLGLVNRCPGAQQMCDGKCVDTGWDISNCGHCGRACVGKGDVCYAMQCLNFRTDKNNCGGYGVVCNGDSPACCGGECVDLMHDINNCRQCGNACPDAEVAGCCDGPSQYSQLYNGEDNGNCKNLLWDRLNCGGCGIKCDYVHCGYMGNQPETCVMGRCQCYSIL